MPPQPLPTTIQDLFSPLPTVTAPQTLESLANTWLPKDLSYDGTGGELGALEKHAQEEENATFEDEGAFYYNNISTNSSYAFETPPSSPSHARSHSAASTPYATPSRSFIPTSLSTPPSEASLHFLNPTPLTPYSTSPAPSDAFNPAVGSPPGRSPRNAESFSLPATPRSIAVIHGEEKRRRNKGPWTWPARGERAREWKEVTTPTKEGAVDLEGEGRMLGEIGSGEEMQERREEQKPLVTRYVRVEGLSRDATEEELRELFVTRYSSLKGCFTALLRTHGVVVLCFHDARHASNSLAALNAPLNSFQLSLYAFCISRESLDMLNSSQPNPLLSPSEAVLILTLHGPPLFPTSLLHTFGGVRSLRLIDPSTFIVEYWDERDAERAAEVLEGKTVGTTRLRCSFEPSVASTGMPVVQVESQVQPQVYRSPARRSQGQEPFGSIGNTLEARTRSYAPRSQGVKGGKSSQVDGYTSPAWSPPRNSPSPSTGVPRSQGGTQWGILREEHIPAGNVLDLTKIEQGFDIRTTLMIKNIPNRLSQADLMAFIDETSLGVRSYDFLYLRIDFSNSCNTGYAFVNFISVETLLQFARARLGTRWNLFQSDKIVVVSYGNIQGKEALVNRFRSSAVMEQPPAFRPRLFYSSGPRAGHPEAFPESDDPRRKARSALNAQTQGLFPASQPVFKVTQALKGMHM